MRKGVGGGAGVGKAKVGIGFGVTVGVWGKGVSVAKGDMGASASTGGVIVMVKGRVGHLKSSRPNRSKNSDRSKEGLFVAAVISGVVVAVGRAASPRYTTVTSIAILAAVGVAVAEAAGRTERQARPKNRGKIKL
jgi:hypothetical protein